MTVNTNTLAVLSTGHLIPAVRAALASPTNPWCVSAVWDHGFFLYLEELEEGAPKCLEDMCAWLHSNDLTGWVRLDAAEPPVAGLPFYGVTSADETYTPAAQPERDYWGENSEFPVEDWKYQVANGDTRRGYWEWIEAEQEAARLTE